MFVILKKTVEKDEILNIFYGQDELLTSIRKWVREYIEEDIKNKKLNDTNEEYKKFKEIIYEINDGNQSFELIKKTKATKKGYIYNVSERVSNVIYSINILECNSNIMKLFYRLVDEIKSRHGTNKFITTYIFEFKTDSTTTNILKIIN